MPPSTQYEKALDFAALHQTSGAFILPNAWDAGSAALLAQSGFKAIGTTSAGIAFSKALPDYENALSRTDNMVAIAAISNAVTLPVSADTEAGYGPTLNDVHETMALTLKAGAVGASLEDFTGAPALGLLDIEEATDRICAAVAAIKSSGIPLTLTARAESFLVGVENPLDDAIERLNRYRAAGADCLYAPGPVDKETIATLVREIDGPLNVVAGLSITSLSVEELTALGVKRISTGGALARACLAALQTASEEILTSGTFSFASSAIPDAELSALFTQRLR